MPIQKGENPHHPVTGSATKVEPIRDLKAIKRIKKLLAEDPRNLCLFILGINTAYRANEILSITVPQVEHLQTGDTLELKLSKQNKYRATPLNSNVIEAIQHWLIVRKGDPQGYLFNSQRGAVLTVPTLTNMVKAWCLNAGLRGNYGSHSLRKTWGYQQRIQNNAPLPLLMEAYGHSTQRQTLDYLGIQAEEISDLYTLAL